MFAEKVIELLKEAERNPVTIDPFNVCCFCAISAYYYCVGKLFGNTIKLLFSGW